MYQLYQKVTYIQDKIPPGGINRYRLAVDNKMNRTNSENLLIYKKPHCGINRHNIAGRISVGTNLDRFGMKIYTDLKITDPLKKYSISDRLFEYTGAIEDALRKATLGLSVYYKF